MIDELIKEGIYTNRSEALRDAVRLQIRMHRGILVGQRLYTRSGTTKLTKKRPDSKRICKRNKLNI